MTNTKQQLYQLLQKQLAGLLHSQGDDITFYAQFAAFIYDSLPDLNWVGFYRFLDNQLILGPFQGKPACVTIPIGEGVCGSAFTAKHTLVVDDVDSFSGHIVCDSASRSEIVIPLISNGRALGVLDIDSPIVARFDSVDRIGLEALVGVLLDRLELPTSPT